MSGAPKVTASDALVQLGNQWQQLHQGQVTDNNNFASQMDTAAVAHQGAAGSMLQQVGDSVQSLNQTSSTQMDGISNAHTQAYTTLTNADDEGSTAVGQVMSQLQ